MLKTPPQSAGAAKAAEGGDGEKDAEEGEGGVAWKAGAPLVQMVTRTKMAATPRATSEATAKIDTSNWYAHGSSKPIPACSCGSVIVSRAHPWRAQAWLANRDSAETALDTFLLALVSLSPSRARIRGGFKRHLEAAHLWIQRRDHLESSFLKQPFTRSPHAAEQESQQEAARWAAAVCRPRVVSAAGRSPHSHQVPGSEGRSLRPFGHPLQVSSPGSIGLLVACAEA